MEQDVETTVPLTRTRLEHAEGKIQDFDKKIKISATVTVLLTSLLPPPIFSRGFIGLVFQPRDTKC